jgi:hypothetical protein
LLYEPCGIHTASCRAGTGENVSCHANICSVGEAVCNAVKKLLMALYVWKASVDTGKFEEITTRRRLIIIIISQELWPLDHRGGLYIYTYIYTYEYNTPLLMGILLYIYIYLFIPV